MRVELAVRARDWADGGLSDAFFLFRLRQLNEKIELYRSLRNASASSRLTEIVGEGTIGSMGLTGEQFDSDRVDTSLDAALSCKPNSKENCAHGRQVADLDKQVPQNNPEQLPEEVVPMGIGQVHPDRLANVTAALKPSPPVQQPITTLLPPTKLRTPLVSTSTKPEKAMTALMNKWKTVQDKVKREQKDEEPPDLAKLEQQKLERIKLWKQEQITSGEAELNPNFQPLAQRKPSKTKKSRKNTP
ncbi:hypothetical protein Pelo_8006 [Pelomyxa schiedti]|nr:hypothetical protein Pelo_8006 [Pelomyxa schiedti]